MKKRLKFWLSSLKNHKSAVLTSILLGIMVDIFLISIRSDGIIFVLMSFYIFATYVYKLTSKNTFIFCLLILLILFLCFIITGASGRTEKAAVWLFLFMTTGVLQEFFFKGINETR